MEIFDSTREYAATDCRSRAALGFFDGVHPGHRAVIDACRAKKGDEKAVVLTFRESPAASLGLPVPAALTDNETKAELLATAGVDAVIYEDFAEIRDMRARDFVREILRDRLHAVQVCCGYNYRFGKGGTGDIEMLRALCDEYGIAVTVIAPVYREGEAVSSTRIRELLTAGEIARANLLLGYPYAVRGDIGSGNHIGTALGFPTVNLPIGKGLCVPRYGVYAARITIDGKSYIGATNIGVHPTVGANPHPLCETFILGYEGGELYGERAVCELLRFIRPEKRFATADALREQVTRDIAQIERESGNLL